MKTALRHPSWTRTPHRVRPFLAHSLLLLFGVAFTRASDLAVGEVTTVSSTVYNGYHREQLPDGSLKPVTYAFGEGTCDPGNVADTSLDRLKFRPLAVLLSGALAKQGYQPSRDAKNIDQLIVVSWGRTMGWDSQSYGDAYGTLNQAYSSMKSAFSAPSSGAPAGPGAQKGPMTRGLGGTPGAADDMDQMMLTLSLQEDARNQANLRNARLLGYEDTLARTPTYFGNLTSWRRDQMIQELEDDRYYVIVIGYDFQTTLKSRKPKVLWITRFSLQAHGNEFDRAIKGMVQSAASYFGRPSDGLRRVDPPEGHAIPGKLELLNYEEPTK